jgi:hypothetical protein
MTTTEQHSSITAVVDAYLAAHTEPDPARRGELIRRAWADGGHIVDPPFTAAGHDQIAAMADAIQQQFAGHRFQRTSGIDEHHDRLRFAWELVGPDGAVAVAGTDVGELAADGRLQRITGFFGDLPPIA